ncbi:hypothetical protein VU07_04160 [Desulfobulbus sp. F4]|nr:hypothetical protein [Desulfobulbus sp. F4]
MLSESVLSDSKGGYHFHRWQHSRSEEQPAPAAGAIAALIRFCKPGIWGDLSFSFEKIPATD